jgi:glycosyltransferase involved in cell wall biosynthesis
MTNANNTSEDIAVVHEHHPMRGGGERVAEDIAETLSAPLFSAYATEDGEPNNLDVEYTELFEEKWYRPLIAREYPYKYAVRDLIYMWAWEDIDDLQDYDVLVQSGNNPGWYVPHDDQTIVKYVHSTPRTAYDLFHHQGTGLMARLYSKATRSLYEQNLSYPDIYVANSDLVAARIRKYWGIDDANIRVVYPPVETAPYTPMRGEPGRFVTVSRLSPAKRIDTIIEAFQSTEYKLDIAGTGPEEAYLRDLAAGHENITLHGYVSEDRKRELLKRAQGFVFVAKNEDFGLAPVEAMAAGTPVVGVRDGFTAHQIRHRESGVLCVPNADSIEAAVRELALDGVEWSPQQLHEFARDNFGTARWQHQLHEVVDEARDSAAISPDWNLPPGAEATETDAEYSIADGGGPGGDSE